MRSYVAGASLLLGCLLLTAGAMKLARPRAFTHAVHRLLPGRREWENTLALVAAPGVGTIELLVGSGLVASAWLPALWRDVITVTAAGLYLAFTVVVSVAIRRGAACGCWGSFSDGPAGGGELGRSLALAGAGLSAGVGTFLVGGRIGFSPWELVSLAALAAVVVLAAAVGGRRDRHSDEVGLGRMARGSGAPPGTARSLAFYLGRVTSSKSGHALPRVARLGPRDTASIVSRVRRGATGQALDAWLGSVGITLDWDSLVARRSSMRTVLGVQRYVLLAPRPGTGMVLTIAVRRNHPDEFEPVVTGDIAGYRLSIRHGEVEARENGSR